jgi:hypothetical protein
MQAILYGDRRDRVKWGALVHLANTNSLRCIAQVAFYRDSLQAKMQVAGKSKEVHPAVWEHFSNLRRVENLAPGVNARIIVLDKPFNPERRRTYIKSVCKDLKLILERPMLIFLDPDTGIEPERSSLRAEHVSLLDIAEIWSTLNADEWLAVYQHLDRRPEWLKRKGDQLMTACEHGELRIITGTGIAADVAILGVRKMRSRRTRGLKRTPGGAA